MSAAKVNNAATDIKGTAVIDAETGHRMGSVGDVLIDPARGEVLGFLVRDHDLHERVLARDRATIEDSALMTRSGALESRAKFKHLEALALREIIGASVITDAGRLLGTIDETQFDARSQKIAYRLKQVGVKKFFSDTLRLPGDASRAYSRLGHRLIVSGDAEGNPPAGVTRSSFAAAKQNFHTGLERYGLAVWFAMTLFLLGAMLWV